MTILTTHAGSLPRTQEIVDFIFARERGAPFDAVAFDAAMTQAVDDTVAKQKAAGVDIVSDGETSKISYATYVKDRYTGFSGDSPRNAPADLKQFPSTSSAWQMMVARQNTHAPCAQGRLCQKGRASCKRTLPTSRRRWPTTGSRVGS